MSTVLIVDDNPADRALFRVLLNRAGLATDEVAYGRDVLPRLREVRPDAVILDVNLPDTLGHNVCRAIRAEPEWAGLPILMLTVRDAETDILAGLEAGADDYVAKDAPAEVILARIRRLVTFRRMSRVAALNEGLVQVGRLLAGIVHEIRGPVSVIRGHAELIRLENPDRPDLAERVDPIVRACQLLQVRLEHLMATVRARSEEPGLVEIAPLLREVTELFRKGTDPRARGPLIRAECPDELPPVQLDPGRLLQVLFNLIGNAHEAITASGRPGSILIRASRTPAESREWLTISIEDDGPGLPDGAAEQIFEPFFTTKPDGSGFGLYLANQIIHDRGGRITAENRTEGGARFTIWLPPAEMPDLVTTSH